MPIYYLVKVRVVGNVPGSTTWRFNVMDQPGIPITQEFSVNWSNSNLVSQQYSVPANPVLAAGMSLEMALSHQFCIMNGIDTAGRVKKPNYLGVDAPPGGWFKVDLTPAAVELSMSATDKIDLLNDGLALPSSLTMNPDGSVSIVLSEAGKSQLSLTGTYPPYTGEETPPASEGAMSKGGNDREKVRALLQAMADLLA